MSLVSPDQVRALVDTALDDATLQEVIDREESMLARAIGPLTGARSVTWYPSSIPPTATLGIPLGRHVSDPDDITVTDGGVAVSASQLRLSPDGWSLLRPGYTWVGPMVVTYTPDDQADVESAIIDLVGLRLTTGGGRAGYAGETIGSYSYSMAGGGGTSTARRQRRAIIRGLLRPTGPTSIRIRGADRLDATLPTA